MSPETAEQVLETIEAEVHTRVSLVEFEMAYQGRVAIERIRFAIKHIEQSTNGSVYMREANLQPLDALDRLESLDRRFQTRSRAALGQNRTVPATLT